MPNTNAPSEVFQFERDDDMEIFGGELYTADALCAVVQYEAEAPGATVHFECSLDHNTWFPFGMTPSDGGEAVASTQATGAFYAPYVWYWTRFRVEGLTDEVITIQHNLVADKA